MFSKYDFDLELSFKCNDTFDGYILAPNDIEYAELQVEKEDSEVKETYDMGNIKELRKQK